MDSARGWQESCRSADILRGGVSVEAGMAGLDSSPYELIITHFLRPTSTERAFGGRKAGILYEGLAGQQASLECGASAPL
jgi:hypothetical protein